MTSREHAHFGTVKWCIPEFARKKRNLHCDIVHVTTKWVSRLVLDHAIAAIQTSRYRPMEWIPSGHRKGRKLM